MKIRFNRFAFWLWVILAIPAWAQPEPATLFRQKLSTAQTDTTRLLACVDLAKYYYPAQPDSYRYFTTRALFLARRTVNTAYNGLLYYFLGRYYKYPQHRNYALSIRYLERSVALAQTVKTKTAALYLLGTIRFDQGNLTAALPHFLASAQLAEQTQEHINLAVNYQLIGMIYLRLQAYEQALIYLERGLSTTRLASTPAFAQTHAASDLNRLPSLMGELLLTKGAVLEKLVRHDEALAAYQQSLRYAQKAQRPGLIASAMNGIGHYWLVRHEFSKAMLYFRQALPYAYRGQKTAEEALAETYTNLGAAFIEKQQADSALFYAHKAVKLARHSNRVLLREQALPVLVDAQIMMGDYRATARSLQELQHLRDSLFAGDKARATAQVGSRYETDKEDKILSLLSQNLVWEQYGRWLLLCVVSLLIVLLLTGIWIYRQGRKTNRLLSDQKQAIEDQAVELYELNQTKDKLFTLLGHELRAPIISLKSTLTLFESNTQIPDDLRQYMSRLQSEIDQYYPMLDNLIHWSLSQQHGLFAVPRVLCLHELTDEVLYVLERPIITKNITIVNRLRPATVLADENHVRIVIRNVLHNALKFTPVGGTITLDLILEDGNAGVMIQDSGRGISAERLVQLFQKPSVRLGTAGEKGTGLGLKLCRELVLLNNGHLRVYSNPNNGTQVLCLFPVEICLVSESVPEELAGTHA